MGHTWTYAAACVQSACMCVCEDYLGFCVEISPINATINTEYSRITVTFVYTVSGKKRPP